MTFRVSQIAERHGVKSQTVLAWIHSGELRAINVACRASSRPQWRVSAESMKSFEAARTTQAIKRGKRAPKRADIGFF